MAKTSFIKLDAGEDELYYRGLNSSDRFVHSRIIKKTHFLSRKKKKKLKKRSYLFELSNLWNGFSEGIKNDWRAVGEVLGLNKFQAFVSEQTARQNFKIPGVASPSLFHNGLVGELSIENPADELKIIQKHSRNYWISQNVSGKKSMKEPVLIDELVNFPIKISLNYSSDLVSLSENSFASFFIRVWSSFKGEDIYTDLVIPLDILTPWCYEERELLAVPGYFINYDIYFHLKDVQGKLWFDNLGIWHSGQNWARDRRCENINEVFTGGFSRVAKNWEEIILPEGSFFKSIYKNFNN